MGSSFCARRVRAVAFTIICLSLGWQSSGVAHDGIEHDIQETKKKLKTAPNSVRDLARRGHLFRLAGRLEDSMRDLDKALQLAPEDAQVRLYRGLTLSALRRDSEAEQELSKALKLGADPALAHLEIGHIRQRHGEFQAAAEEFKLSLAAKPDVHVYLMRGKVLEASGLSREALSCYQQGWDATHGELVSRALVRTLIASNHHKSALAHIDERLTRAQMETELLLQRAQVLVALGRHSEARSERKHALREANMAVQAKASAVDFTRRARVYLSLNKRVAAQRDLRQALLRVPDYSSAIKLLEQLERRSFQAGSQRASLKVVTEQ